MIASRKGHIDIVNMLINAPSADVNLYNSDGNDALIMASDVGNFDIAKLLIHATPVGADITRTNNKGNSALIIAFIKGHLNIVELIHSIVKIQG